MSSEGLGRRNFVQSVLGGSVFGALGLKLFNQRTMEPHEVPEADYGSNMRFEGRVHLWEEYHGLEGDLYVYEHDDYAALVRDQDGLIRHYVEEEIDGVDEMSSITVEIEAGIDQYKGEFDELVEGNELGGLLENRETDCDDIEYILEVEDVY